MNKTLLFFDGKRGQSNNMNISGRFNSTVTLETEVSSSDEEDHPFKSEEIIHSVKQEERAIINSSTNVDTQESSSTSDNKDIPFNTTGVLMSIYLNTCFSYCFAVQETITTPMVMKLYNWSATEINLLFAAAGMTALITSFSIQYITQYVRDQTLLIAGIGIGLIGSILQVDIPQIEKTLPASRFIVGFILTYFSFPVRRIVVMGIFSNVLGPSNQGSWMGVMTAVGMMARSVAPFIAWQAMQAVNWSTWLDFGLCSLFLLSALVGTIITIDYLVPYDEFVEMRTTSEYQNDAPNAAKSAVAIDAEKRQKLNLRHLFRASRG